MNFYYVTSVVPAKWLIRQGFETKSAAESLVYLYYEMLHEVEKPSWSLEPFVY